MLSAIVKKFEIGKLGRPFALLSDLQLKLAKYVLLHMQELGFELCLSCLILKKFHITGFQKSGISMFNRNAITLKSTASSTVPTEIRVKIIKKTNSSYTLLPMTYVICSLLATKPCLPSSHCVTISEP
jgi:hypothetical protein